jgi:hypothetical protein
MIDPRELALTLKAFRLAGNRLPVGAIEALAFIASGIDHAADLGQAMADHDGKPLDRASVHRFVRVLQGQARWREGRWIYSPLEPLIQASPHPHRRGSRLSITPAGRETLGLSDQPLQNPA